MSAGILSVLSFAKESTWGTAVTPTKSVAIRPTGGLVSKENTQLIPAIRGQLSKNYGAIKGKVSHEGSFTLDAFEDYLGYLFLSAMGTDTPALVGGETSVYSHIFTETAAKPSLTIEQAIAEDVRRFAGAICNEIKISGKVGETVQADALFMAKTFATASAITPAFTTAPSFNHTQVVVKIGGSAIPEVESFEFNYKNNLEMVYALIIIAAVVLILVYYIAQILLAALGVPPVFLTIIAILLVLAFIIFLIRAFGISF